MTNHIFDSLRTAGCTVLDSALFRDAFGTSDQRALVEDVLPQFFASLEGVGELVVVKTMSGGAQPVAEAIDAAGWPEIIGTLGGENVVLIICRSAAARERVEKKIQRVTQA